MTNKLQLARCPYCNQRTSYVESFLLKNKGEYECKKCKKNSNIVIKRSIYGLIAGTCISSLIILVCYLLLGDHGNPLGIFLVLLPFILFYAAVPFFVRLTFCKEQTNSNYRKRSN